MSGEGEGGERGLPLEVQGRGVATMVDGATQTVGLCSASLSYNSHLFAKPARLGYTLTNMFIRIE